MFNTPLTTTLLKYKILGLIDIVIPSTVEGPVNGVVYLYPPQITNRFPELISLLSTFKDELAVYIPEHMSCYLFGGITLGDFSPTWSDVDVIVWVERPEVSDDLIERSFRLWNAVAQITYGCQLYMYIAPHSVAGGPMNPAGEGTSGQPRSLRVYRGKWREMQGYPLSLPDTVCLTRYGVLLSGEDIRSELPPVPDTWAEQYLSIQISQLQRVVRQKVGPFGEESEAAAEAWGPEGIMSFPLWFARHLYSLEQRGEVTSKRRAAEWYLQHHRSGALATSLQTILRWRTEGTISNRCEVVYVASLMKECTMEFLHHVAAAKELTGEKLPTDLEMALEIMARKL